MDYPTHAVPEPAPLARAHDPLAVALGNASLLGVGYLVLGRRKLAVAAGVVTLAIELGHVRSLLEGPTDTPPEYCSTPAKYSGAAPYRKGTNRALFYGNDEYTGKLPAKWRTTDAARAVLVVCADEEEEGTSVQTCPYENKTFPQFPRDVTFHKIAIPVKVYELRTGKRVADRKVQIGGKSCPETLSYTTYGPTDLGPPSDTYVNASNADVRAGFKSLINRWPTAQAGELEADAEEVKVH